MIKMYRDQSNLCARAGKMSKLVQYKINRIPTQICFCLVFDFFPVCWLIFFSTACLFRQRCMATSDSNTTESFCVPRSWTNNLSRRHKRHRKYGKCCIYLFMVYLIFTGLKDSLENNMKNLKKLFFLSRRLSVSQQQLSCSIS